jgi:beta-aspartyl-peptidase (threonine type)
VQFFPRNATIQPRTLTFIFLPHENCNMIKPKLIVHGGAWNIPEDMLQDHVRGVKQAVSAVYPHLLNGMSALDAVEAAVKILEEDPTFDAGRGAFLNAMGEIELDAMIMDGSTLEFGAVAAVQNLLHPVTLARMIMEKTEHCFLVGQGAQLFARHNGFEILETADLLIPRELEFYNQFKNDPKFTTKKPFEDNKRGTVGAVARDQTGSLAAATSTGGTPRKLPGRVGDTPLMGAGTYADDQLGAASATGWGESIMKVLLSKNVCDNLLNQNATDAAKSAIEMLQQRVDGLGGVILIDKQGKYGYAHNTSKMAFAFAASPDTVIAKIKI